MGDWTTRKPRPGDLAGLDTNMYYKFIGSNKAESKAVLASVR